MDIFHLFCSVVVTHSFTPNQGLTQTHNAVLQNTLRLRAVAANQQAAELVSNCDLAALLFVLLEVKNTKNKASDRLPIQRVVRVT